MPDLEPPLKKSGYYRPAMYMKKLLFVLVKSKTTKVFPMYVMLKSNELCKFSPMYILPFILLDMCEYIPHFTNPVTGTISTFMDKLLTNVVKYSHHIYYYHHQAFRMDMSRRKFHVLLLTSGYGICLQISTPQWRVWLHAKSVPYYVPTLSILGGMIHPCTWVDTV